MTSFSGDIRDNSQLNQLHQLNSLLISSYLHHLAMPAHPDSNLYPEASGLAKALVDQHQAEQPLKLYAGWFCPYATPLHEAYSN